MMPGFIAFKDRPLPFSVTVAAVVAFWYMAVLASLTVFTHLAQFFSMPFRTYAYISLPIALAVSGLVFFSSGRLLRESFPKDPHNLLFVLLLGLAALFLSVSLHRLGRSSPDEYYYTANPVYYLQNPQSAMGFEARTFYSGGDPIYSVAYLTAGAYEYVQAAAAFFLHARFVTIYYAAAAGLAGFLIPLSVFLAVFCFSGSPTGAVWGTFVTLCAMVVTGETSWTPGIYSFLRAFEGKAFLLFGGIPLFVAFSWLYFARWNFRHWLYLAALVTALAGMSTSSFIILPALGAILIVSYWAVFRDSLPSARGWLLHFISYFAIFAYMAAFAYLVGRADHVRYADFFNKDYPSTFAGYVNGFVFQPFPTTPILTVVFTLAALVLASGRARALLGLWILLVILLILNPLVSPIWLAYFKGIYFRLFYLLPFPLVVGFAISALYSISKEWTAPLRRWIRVGLVIAPLAGCFLLPTSILVNPVYVRGNWLRDNDLIRAQAIVDSSPPGVMLAPFPLSGAVRMLDARFPQMITRNDVLLFYLEAQGREDDARLRVRTKAFLTGDTRNFRPMLALLDLYPEIRSIVIDQSLNERAGPPLAESLQEKGFTVQRSTLDLIIYSRPD